MTAASGGIGLTWGLPASASATTVVVPNALTSTEGDTDNAWPFDCGGLGLASQRYQQVYAGSEVGTGTISQIAFRPDGTYGASFGPTTLPGVTITLSTTTKTVGGLSSTFADNIGSDVTTVYSGDLTLSSANTGSGPKDFDIAIPLQHSFEFNSAGGNLLLDVTVPTCEATTAFDATDASTASVSREYTFAGSSTSPTADGSFNNWGLVTQFTLAPSGSTYWPLDENTGTVAHSSPVAGNDATLGPSGSEPAWDAASKAPVGGNVSSLDFSGANYALVPDAPQNNLTTGSWDTWVNFAQTPATAGHSMNLLSKSNQYWFHATTATENGDTDGDVGPNAIEAKITVAGTRYVAHTATSFIRTGQWYHLTATYDGSNLDLYVNGVLEGTTPVSGNIDTTSNPLAFGTWSASPGADSLVGSLDEPRLFATALSASDVAAQPQPVPTAQNVGDSTTEDTAKLVTLNATEPGGGALSYIVTSLPANGKLKDGTTAITSVPYALSGNTVTYMPNPNYNNADTGTSTSPDTFNYKANDGVQDSNSATVSMTVLSQPDLTTTRYTGQTQAFLTKTGKINLAGTITSTDPACVAGQTVLFWLNKNPTVANSTTPYQLPSGTTGAASGTGPYTGTANVNAVSTGNWQPGNYTITAQFTGYDSGAGTFPHTVCGGSQGQATLKIQNKTK